MSDNRDGLGRTATAVGSALALALASMALGACDDLEPIPTQQADDETTSPHAEEEAE